MRTTEELLNSMKVGQSVTITTEVLDGPRLDFCVVRVVNGWLFQDFNNAGWVFVPYHLYVTYQERS